MRSTGDGWRHSLDVNAILREPDVRERIVAAGGEAGARMDPPAFPDRLVQVAGPLVGTEMQRLARSRSHWIRRGVGVRRQRTEDFDDPPGELITRVLVSMARQDLLPTGAGPDGRRCTLQAQILADLWTFGGSLEVHVEPHDAHVRVSAETVVPGQVFDWGKSKRVLRRLFDDLRGPA